MKLSISHHTTYSYDKPVRFALQQLRLIPRTGHGQKVHNWTCTVEGGQKQLSFDDQFMNHTELVKVDPGATRIDIISKGVVEVEDLHGVVGAHSGYSPLWLYKAPTSLTTPGTQMRQLAEQVKSDLQGSDEVARLHELSALILKNVSYETGQTQSNTTAEDALDAGHGVCQDHAHIMIAMARELDHPARYVSGYLFMDGQVDQDASHAWCEIWTQSLGWIGFDVSNGISPDSRYVRVATGRDYSDAAPILGIRHGEGQEALQVTLQVQQ